VLCRNRFTDFDHHGIQGSFDGAISAGQDGYRHIGTIAGRIALSRPKREARDGYQVHLTVDLHLQNIVENEIDAAMPVRPARRDYSMRPQTGEILAMANRPNFDLISLRRAEQMANRAVIDSGTGRSKSSRQLLR
jgi:cell division protein FtsI/penicillin-binding protein 2